MKKFYRSLTFSPALLLMLVMPFQTIKSQNIPFALPDHFPKVTVSGHSENASGYYFLNTFGILPTHDSAWLMVLDSTGLPLFYQMFHTPVTNFTLQPETGTLTFWNWNDTTFYEMDSSYQIIKSYRSKGYITNGHELRLKSDGSYWIMAEDPQTIDMSQLIEGGNPNALVIGCIIQHVSSTGSLLFEWSSWNHFNILDADTNLVNLRGPKIDYVHGNAFDFDSDSTLLLSSRCMDEITKININTGNIVWRWGGKHNEFSCLNDTIPFLAQHDIRYLGNSLYSLFDNGIWNVRPYSRAMLYFLDDTTKTTSVVDDFKKVPMDFSKVMGSMQQLPNGNYLVGWSLNFQKNVLSEFNENGDIVYEMNSVDTGGLISYRAQKYDWQTNIFYFGEDTLDFGEPVFVGDSLLQSVTLFNNSDEVLVLNDHYVTDTAFRLQNSFPLSLAPNESHVLNILFKPDTTKQYSAVLSLFHDTDTTLFGQQIRLTGGGLITNIHRATTQNKWNLFPNPADDQITLQGSPSTKITTLQVFSLEGKKMTPRITIHSNHLAINASTWTNGVYIVKIMQGNQPFSQMLIIHHAKR